MEEITGYDSWYQDTVTQYTHEDRKAIRFPWGMGFMWELWRKNGVGWYGNPFRLARRAEEGLPALTEAEALAYVETGAMPACYEGLPHYRGE